MLHELCFAFERHRDRYPDSPLLKMRKESKQTVADSSPALWIIFENDKIRCFVAMIQFIKSSIPTAAIAQLGERQTEDLKVPGSIPGGGTFYRPPPLSGNQKPTTRFELVTSRLLSECSAN